MAGDLDGIDIFASSNIITLIWMSQKGVCWRAGFSAVTAVFLVLFVGLLVFFFSIKLLTYVLYDVRHNTGVSEWRLKCLN